MNGRKSWHGEAEAQALLPVSERLSFVYLEHCRIHRDQNAVTAQDESGTTYIPVASVACLLVGPGTAITHQAVALLADSGVTIVWVGDHGTRYYAHGRPLGTGTTLLQRQAELVVSRQKRLAVARRMYSMRFPGEDVSGLTMQQLRGREGARVRAAYRRWSAETGVPWRGRNYHPQLWSAADSVNQALSAANAVLYGITHSIVVALGCSPGLGFIHTGHAKAFVHDISDLYKAELTIPTAFRVVAEGEHALGARVRRATREAIHESNLLQRVVRDVKWLLGSDEAEDTSSDVVALWDPRNDAVAGGVNYAEEFE